MCVWLCWVETEKSCMWMICGFCIVVNYITLGMSSCVSILQSFNSVLSARLICEVKQALLCSSANRVWNQHNCYTQKKTASHFCTMDTFVDSNNYFVLNYLKHHERNSLICFSLSGENKHIFDR